MDACGGFALCASFAKVDGFLLVCHLLHNCALFEVFQMTNASEVVVIADDAAALLLHFNFRVDAQNLDSAKRILQRLIAKRVPDASTKRDDINDESGMFTNGFSAGFNACRERVLKGE